MNGKHTPGPWPMTTVPTSCGVCHKIGRFPGSGVHEYGSACVYVDRASKAAEAELKANARLIAAAPEMLEMLRDRLVDDCHCVHCTKTRALILRVEGGAE